MVKIKTVSETSEWTKYSFSLTDECWSQRGISWWDQTVLSCIIDQHNPGLQEFRVHYNNRTTLNDSSHKQHQHHPSLTPCFTWKSEAKRKPIRIIVCFHQHYCCNFGLIDWTDFIFYNSMIMLHKWFVSWPAPTLEHEWITNDDSFNSQPAAMRLFWKIALLVLIMTWYFSS